jgi:pre-mRNA-splicing factor ATP-dependent RNA helicase DHX15/PRP43
VLPLYSALPYALQKQVFENSDRRKCIISTNIAETSLTIEGIVYVVDSGLVKQLVYNPRCCLDMLQVVPISRAAANQRAGRAGRTQPGTCFRLYSKEAFDSVCPVTTLPAIISSDIKSVMLSLKSLGYSNLLDVDWIDPPAPESYLRGLEELNDL